VSVKLESIIEFNCLVFGSQEVPWLLALAIGLNRSKYHGRAVARRYAIRPDIYIRASLSFEGRK
jgi:hypothetical protein